MKSRIYVYVFVKINGRQSRNGRSNPGMLWVLPRAGRDRSEGLGSCEWDVGVLTVFEAQKGIEKMPVVLTGKSKLHVFTLRRAK